jgi:hypothetical protein
VESKRAESAHLTKYRFAGRQLRETEVLQLTLAVNTLTARLGKG